MIRCCKSFLYFYKINLKGASISMHFYTSQYINLVGQSFMHGDKSGLWGGGCCKTFQFIRLIRSWTLCSTWDRVLSCSRILVFVGFLGHLFFWHKKYRHYYFSFHQLPKTDTSVAPTAWTNITYNRILLSLWTSHDCITGLF